MEYALSIKCTGSNHQEASIHYLSLEILTIIFGTLRQLQTAVLSLMGYYKLDKRGTRLSGVEQMGLKLFEVDARPKGHFCILENG